jgi:hypothetical protein
MTPSTFIWSTLKGQVHDIRMGLKWYALIGLGKEMVHQLFKVFLNFLFNIILNN